MDDHDLGLHYLGQRMTSKDTAGLLGVSVDRVRRRLRKLGWSRSNSEAHMGLRAGNFKGGTVDAGGYHRTWVGGKGGKQIRTHRLVAEQMLGRPLAPDEVVHHKDGNRLNNDPSNLEVYSSHSEHMRDHMTPERAREMGAKGNATRRLAAKAAKEGEGG